MKIALIGYGKMGREIEQVVADSKKHEIVSISYRKSSDFIDKAGIKKADVAIDFTAPEVVVSNIKEVANIGVNLVVGTTGWYGNLPEVKNIASEKEIGIIYGQNFSIGANIFFDIVKYASGLVNKFDGYDVFGTETHHVGKKDSPSGTAKKIIDVIMDNYPRKKTVITNTLDRSIQPEELHFTSVRGGRNFGRHEIAFDSQADEIRLIHQAWSRRGFAEGSLKAAEFIKGKKGLYNFSDIFGRLSK